MYIYIYHNLHWNVTLIILSNKLVLFICKITIFNKIHSISFSLLIHFQYSITVMKPTCICTFYTKNLSTYPQACYYFQLSHHFAWMIEFRQIATVPLRGKNTDSSIFLLAIHTRVCVQVSRLITDDESRVQPSN